MHKLYRQPIKAIQNIAFPPESYYGIIIICNHQLQLVLCGYVIKYLNKIKY